MKDHGPLVPVDSVPEWLRGLVAHRRAGRGRLPPDDAGRRGAPRGRADAARRWHERPGRAAAAPGRHARLTRGPGGVPRRRGHPGDAGPVDTALREAVEEVGLEPSGVRPLALLPRMYVPVSGFDVTPVLAHWIMPSAVRAVDPAETAAVAGCRSATWSIREPAAGAPPVRLGIARLPVSRHADLGIHRWAVDGAARCGELADRPWDSTVVRDLDSAWRAAMALAPLGDTLPPANAEVQS